MASVRAARDGFVLRFGDVDTPGPEGVIPLAPPPRVVVALSPVDSRAKVGVIVRSREGERILGLRSARRTREEQFYEGSFPHLRPGDRVEYAVRVEFEREGKPVRLDSSEVPGGVRVFELASGVGFHRAARAPAPESVRVVRPETMTPRAPEAPRMLPGDSGDRSSRPPDIGGRAASVSGRTFGTIALEHGAVASEVTVRLYQRCFGGTRTLLSEGRTTQGGAYDLTYSVAGSANVELYSVSADGTEVQLSQTKFGAQVEERLDLIAPSRVQPPQAEFKRLADAVSSATGGRPETLGQAIERGTRRDLGIMSTATGWDAGALAVASEAFRLAGQTSIPADGLYAMARVGVPMETRTLARLSKKTVRTALRRAAEAGIVDAARIDATVEALAEFASDYRFNHSVEGALSSPKDFVGRARVTEADRAAFTKVAKEEESGDIWTRARAGRVSEAGIQKLQLQGKLAYLTYNNAELVDALSAKITESPLELIPLGYYEAAQWEKTIDELSDGVAVRRAALVPPAFGGGQAEGRVHQYAEELARRVRQMDTHAVTIDRIVTGKIEGVAERTDVGKFLTNAAGLGYRLGGTPLSAFVNSHEEAVWTGIATERRDKVLASARMLSSLYSVSPGDEELEMLLLAGYTSSLAIARTDPAAFKLRMRKVTKRPKAGDTKTTEAMYFKAQQQSATVFNVFNGLKRLNSVPYAPGSTPSDAQKRDDQIVKVREKLSGLFPTLESLFGSVDYCECDHCQSVLSPAAYLVDLLRFLDPDEDTWTTAKGLYRERTGADYTKRRPFDVLNDRRPDIKNIALTCENTNTVLPYIDVVNEILEQVMMADTTPPAIEAHDVGSAKSADLLAEPQNILWSAYVGAGTKKGLRDLVYPLTLPFDLPLEMVRAVLKQLDPPLWRLRECVLAPTSLAPSAPGLTDGWMDVWFERLGLSPGDVAAITRSADWHLLFGYPSAGDSLKTEVVDGVTRSAESSLRNGRTLARRLGVTYKELAELVRTRFINPEIENLIALNRIGVDPETADRYFGEGTALSAGERTDFEAGLEAHQIQPAELQPLRSDAIRQATVVLRSPSVGCDFSKTTLAFDKEPPDVDQAMTFVLLKMHAFVRLQRRLGWDIHDLDRALMALVPGVRSLTPATWSAAMRTGLIYLAHVEELRQRLVDVEREEILVFWSDIPTQGMSSLYERLFLSASVLGGTAAFRKRLGRALDGTAAIADHIDGISQALQLAHDDVEPILRAASAADRALSIQNLSILMRYAVLARGLQLPVAELPALLTLSERKPFAPLDAAPITHLVHDMPWSETLGFVREVELVRDAGVDVVFLERICRHRGLLEPPSPDTDPVVIALLAVPPADPALPGKRPMLLVQTLAAQLAAPEAIVDDLLGTVLKDAAGGFLKATGFADNATSIRSLRRLQRTLDLVQSLDITVAELSYLKRDTAALNPNDLPSAEVTDPAVARTLWTGLKRWLEFVAARKQFGKSGRLLAVLNAARQPIDAVNTAAAREKTLHEALAALVGRKPVWLQPALEAIGARSTGAAVFEVAALAEPRRIRRTVDALRCLSRLRLNPADVVHFSRSAIDEAVAQKVRSSLKGRYSAAAWRRLVQPIFDSLRKKQRDALVAHLTHVMDGERPKYGETMEKLFEYLLLDPGMEPVVEASRIQLAISSVQLFVQRCLMNLEPDGVDPQIIDRKRFEPMRRYRVFEVQRKIFIWAENWLDQEFRDDKSHLFRDLEGKLLKDDVNDDLVRRALHDYLKGLEEIARLEMLTMYFEPGVSADGSIVHVVGRTTSGPLKYFYRTVSHGMWTPWEPIDVGIEGSHLVLTSWRGRMHVFWVTFLEEPTESSTMPTTFKPSTDSLTVSDLRASTKVKVQLHWVEQIRGKWVNRSSTPGFVDTAFTGLKATTEEDKATFFVRAVRIDHSPGAADDDLEIHITASGKGHKFVLFSKLAPPRSVKSGGTAATAPPFGSGATASALKTSSTKWHGDTSLTAKFVSTVTESSAATDVFGSDKHPVLGSGNEFTLLFPSNENMPVPARTPPTGVGRPSGFVFRPQKAQHVVYRSADGSIHDLLGTTNGWFYQAVSADADSVDPLDSPEPTASDPHGYPLDDRGTIAIAYSGATRIHELVWSQLDETLGDESQLAAGWHFETLYQGGAAADQPQGRPYGGMFLPKRGVVFRTKDGRLRAAIEPATGTLWELKEMNVGLAKAVSDPTGLLMTKTELGVTSVVSRHIFYVGDDGDVHDLRSDAAGQTWTHVNVTQSLAGVVKPAPGATPAAYAFLGQNSLHVVYRGPDDRIHELWGLPGSWNYAAIGAAFTKVKGDPVGYVTESDNVQHVVYRGESDHIVELSWRGVWGDHILTEAVSSAPRAKSDVAGYSFEAGRTQHVAYFAADGSPHELWCHANWHTTAYYLSNPFSDPLGGLASPFFYEAESRDHTFFVEPYVVETMAHEWTEWIVTTKEWVEPEILSIPLVPLYPEAGLVIPSDVSVIKNMNRFKKQLLDDGIMMKTTHGVILQTPGISPEVERFGKQPVTMVLDLKRGGLAPVMRGRGGMR